MASTIKQLEERQLPHEVTIMKWSPNTDLLAVANAKGELSLYRLSWQRVWALPLPEEGETIRNIAWRPDGKIIAILYQKSKNLCMVDIENKNIVYKIQLKSDNIQTSCMNWLSLTLPGSKENIFIDENICTSCTGEYLPVLPNLNRSYGQEPERKEFLSQTLDMLFLGQENGAILMYIFGMFYCGELSIGSGPVMEVSGGAGKALWASWKNKECINVVRLSCTLLENSQAFLNLAQIQGHMECLMDYLSRSINSLSEAWETILLEMDEKIAKYAADKPPGSVAADFLELLMIGVPTPELKTFLIKDLTEKGLKKLGHSIDMCYSNIQKLVLKNLSSVGMAFIYHLAEMRGMVRFGGAYEALGFKEEKSITDAIGSAQSFLAKTSEVQQVIDHSMRDYKAFIRWLYTITLRLNDERIPPEMSRVSQQDLTYIAEFLQGFDKIEETASKRKVVNLEKLGQYLRSDPLQTCFSPEGSEWASFLVENKCLQKHSLIIKQDFKCSLLQAHASLIEAINKVFVCAYQDLTKHFKQIVMPLPFVNVDISAQVITNEGNLIIAVPTEDRKMLQMYKIEFENLLEPLISKFIQIDVQNRQAPSESTALNERQLIVDVKFYSLNYVSLLLLNEANKTSSLIQLSLDHPAFNDLSDMSSGLIFNLSKFEEVILCKSFQDIFPKTLVVSGSRKVAILNENKRKVRILEAEANPEDATKVNTETSQENMMDDE